MSGPEEALATCRFVRDGAALSLWGAFGYLAALVPRDLGCETAHRLTVFRIGAVMAAVAATAAILPIDVATIGDGWAAVFDRASVGAVLFETSVGRAWQAEAVAALLLGVTFAMPGRVQPGATAAASGLLLASVALTGHAAMHEGWPGALHRLNAILHLWTGGAWLGALLALPPILRALDDPLRRRDAGLALRRFSTAGHAAVALVIATGAINTWLILGRWPTEWSLPYQALLAVKIVLVLGMTILALVNRYVLVPGMARCRAAAVHTLRRAVFAQIGLGLAVLGCVSIFGLLEPV